MKINLDRDAVEGVGVPKYPGWISRNHPWFLAQDVLIMETGKKHVVVHNVHNFAKRESSNDFP